MALFVIKVLIINSKTMTASNSNTEKEYKDWGWLKENNPWKKEIFNNDPKNLLERLLKWEEGEFVYSKDKAIIDNRNNVLANSKKKKDNVFKTSLLPKPYRGNLKDPKLVILSLNPGYNERTKKKMFEMLNEKYQLKFVEIAKKNALLEDGCSIIPDDNEDSEGYWVDVVTDNGYWLDKLSDLINEPDVDISKIGLIQFIPYASKHYDSWAKEDELETQKFSVDIIRRLLYKDESTLFLVMRAKKQWDKLFRKYNIELDKEISRRFLYNNNPICQKISHDNIGKFQYERIKAALTFKG